MGGKTTTTSTVNAPNTLGDFKLQSTSYGKSIPKVWGQARIEGNVTALEGFRILTSVEETSNRIDEGKGGHIDYTRDYTYTYAALLQISLAEIITAPYSIGWIWEQNRKTRFLNSSLANSLETLNELATISLDYEMGTKPQLPNFAFEVNGSTGVTEWEEINNRSYTALDQTIFLNGRARFSAANDKYLGAAYLGVNDQQIIVIAHKISPVINGVGGAELLFSLNWNLPVKPNPTEEHIVVHPNVAIKGEFLYVSVNGSFVTNSTYGTMYLLCYNLKTKELVSEHTFSYTSLDFNSWSGASSLSADTDFLFIVTGTASIKILVYDITQGVPVYQEKINFRDRDIFISNTIVFAANNSGKLFILEGNTTRDLYEYYYPTDTLLKIPDFLESPEYPGEYLEVLDFTNDGEDLGVAINYYRNRDPNTPQEVKMFSVGLAFMRGGGSVEYYTLPENSAWSARGGSLNIKNGFLAIYVNPVDQGTVFTEWVVQPDNTLKFASSDVYSIGENIFTSEVAFGVITENFKGGYYIDTISDLLTRSDLRIFARYEDINDVYPSEIIEDFLTTDDGLNLSDVVDVDVSQLQTYCEDTGLQCSLALTERRTAFNIIGELLTVSNGVVRQNYNLDLEFLPYQNYSDVKAVITDDDIIGTIKDFRASVDSIPSAVRVEYSNRDIEYNTDIYEERNSTITDFQNVSDLNLKTVKRNDVASKVSKLQIQRKGFIKHMFAFSVAIKYLDLLPGDYITLNSKKEEIINQKLYIIEAIENDLSYDLVCEEYVENINSVSEVPEYESEASRADITVSPGAAVVKLFRPVLNVVYVAAGGSTYWKDSRVFVSYDKGKSYSLLDTIPYNNFIGKVLEYQGNELVVAPLTANVPSQTGNITCDQGAFGYSAYTIALDGTYTFYMTSTPVKKFAKNSNVTVIKSGGNSPYTFFIPDQYVNSTLFFKVEARNIYNSSYQNSANMPAYRLGGQDD